MNKKFQREDRESLTSISLWTNELKMVHHEAKLMQFVRKQEKWSQQTIVNFAELAQLTYPNTL